MSDTDLPAPMNSQSRRWLAELQSAMRGAQVDLSGIVARSETVRPEGEETTSAGSADVSTRTQLALIRSAANGDAEVQLSEVLQDAGVTPEMFRQITERTDFGTTFLDLNKRYFFITRMPQMLAAMSASAMGGNVKAFDSLARFFGDQDGKLGGDLAGQVLHGSPDAVLRLAERQHQEIGELIELLRAAQEASVRKTAAEAEARAAILKKAR